MEKLLKIQDVSDLLSVNVSTVRSWVFNKKIPCIRLGRLVRFKESALEKWVEDENNGGGD